ncbi:MAG: cadherin repeat domain-containing protein [Planctomycetaceae bacterium]|nr:cadherin repeat domain-containing protein [Planctomycetaceae bacterium]
MQVRAIGSDYNGAPMVGSWSSFNVTLTPPSNSPPSVTGLNYVTEDYGSYYAGGTLTGSVSDDRPNSVFTLDIDTDNNGTIDRTTATGYGDPEFSLDLELNYGSHTLKVRASELDSITGEIIYGDWESLDVDVTPPSDAAPDVSGLSYTITAINYGSGKGTLAGSIDDDGVHPPSYKLQYDLNNDGIADGDPTGDYPFDSNGTSFSIENFEVPLGQSMIRVRAVTTNAFTGVTLAGAWASVNADATNTPPEFQGGTTIPATPLGATKEYTFNKPENLVGYIGTVASLESDPGDMVSYELVPGTGAGITIDANTGALSIDQPFNFETFKLAGAEPEVRLTVRAFDTNGGQNFAEVVVRIGDITNEPSITFGAANNTFHNAIGAVNGPASWGVSPWVPSIVAQQFYGDSSGAEIWNQGGTGNGAFSTSGATGNSISSSVTVQTDSGNACNTVINGYCYIGASGDAGQLEISLKGFSPGSYTIVFAVTTTITVNSNTPTGNPLPGGFATIDGVSQGATANGLSFLSGTAGTSKTFVNWCATTVVVTNPLDLFRVMRWIPTISFNRGMPGEVTISGSVRIAEITGP